MSGIGVGGFAGVFVLGSPFSMSLLLLLALVFLFVGVAPPVQALERAPHSFDNVAPMVVAMTSACCFLDCTGTQTIGAVRGRIDDCWKLQQATSRSSLDVRAQLSLQERGKCDMCTRNAAEQKVPFDQGPPPARGPPLHIRRIIHYRTSLSKRSCVVCVCGPIVRARGEFNPTTAGPESNRVRAASPSLPSMSQRRRG